MDQNFSLRQFMWDSLHAQARARGQCCDHISAKVPKKEEVAPDRCRRHFVGMVA
jgi:hypothetical protein